MLCWKSKLNILLCPKIEWGVKLSHSGFMIEMSHLMLILDLGIFVNKLWILRKKFHIMEYILHHPLFFT